MSTNLEEFNARCPQHPTKLAIWPAGSKGALVDFDRFDEVIERCNKTFGDPTKPVTGPRIPAQEKRK